MKRILLLMTLLAFIFATLTLVACSEKEAISPDSETAATEAAADGPEKERRSGGSLPYCSLPATADWCNGLFGNLEAIEEMDGWIRHLCATPSGCPPGQVVDQDTLEFCFDNELYMGSTTNSHDWVDDIITRMLAIDPDYDLVRGRVLPYNGFGCSGQSIDNTDCTTFTARAVLILQKCVPVPTE